MFKVKFGEWGPFPGLLLAGILILAGCSGVTSESQLPRLEQDAGGTSGGLIPQEYLCPGTKQAAPEPRLVKEIAVFLEKNQMFGGLPAGVASDLPIILNVPVQKYLHSFANSKNFHASLARSGLYLAMMRRIFAEHGLPQDLIYIALVESGFSPYARSPKEAVGIWQFIEGTARRYGLKVNDRVDERQDPEKSTRAAARYLHDLYQQFGCWYLAAAGYNAGENRVEGVMNRHDIQDFWVMAQKKLLPEETCNYVPQIVAAALIAKEPEKYGMAPIKYQSPRPGERVKVPGGVTLEWVAESLEMPVKELTDLNPELKAGAAPSDQKEYLLTVPANKVRPARRLAALFLSIHNSANSKIIKQ
jgi:membrane-bound lytic murein transglycosylase D